MIGTENHERHARLGEGCRFRGHFVCAVVHARIAFRLCRGLRHRSGSKDGCRRGSGGVALLTTGNRLACLRDDLWIAAGDGRDPGRGIAPPAGTRPTACSTAVCRVNRESGRGACTWGLGLGSGRACIPGGVSRGARGSDLDGHEGLVRGGRGGASNPWGGVGSGAVDGGEAATPAPEGGIGEVVLLDEGEQGESAVAMLAEVGLDLVPGPARASRRGEGHGVSWTSPAHAARPPRAHARQGGRTLTEHVHGVRVHRGRPWRVQDPAQLG